MRQRVMVVLHSNYQQSIIVISYQKLSIIKFIPIMSHQAEEMEKQSVFSLDKRVWSLYHQLQKAVDNMDSKVEVTLKKNQSQFLYAYRTHIHKIKKQLENIKNKSQQQQKMFSSNDRIRFLEKQNSLFRDEAIKLYEKLQNKTIEINIAKNKVTEAQKISKKLQDENKQLILELKKVKSMQTEHLRNIQMLQDSLNEKNTKLEEMQKKRFQQRKMREHMIQVKSRASLAKSRDNSPRQIPTHKNELQQWFLECVKSVKRQIQQRKNNFDAIDFSKVNSISEFRLVDKLKLFEMLLQNQKLLTWLYHKIFPDKLDKINHYLTQSGSVPLTDTDINSEGHVSSRYGSVEQNLQLPKVPGKKVPSYSLRNQIVIKNGKMNISIA